MIKVSGEPPLHSVDLHCHTTASDGSLTPSELVSAAAGIGLSAIAITDHDTLDGLAEGVATGGSLGVEVIPGVEISVRYPIGRCHLLGYLIDPGSNALRERLRTLKANRAARNQRMVDRMQSMGMAVTMDDMLAESGGGQIGRPHMARVLVRKGVATSVQDAFDRFLAKGAAAHVPKDKIGLEEGIELIHAVDALAVLAHPLTLKLDASSLAEELHRLRGLGLDGVECYYSQHDEGTTAILLQMAEEVDLLPTGGSDYHGTTKPGVSLGRVICDHPAPDSVLDEMKRRHSAGVRRDPASVAGGRHPED